MSTLWASSNFLDRDFRIRFENNNNINMQTGYSENYALLKAFNLNGPFLRQ